jgi:hypothetical protein
MGKFSVDQLLKDSTDELFRKLDETTGSSYRDAIVGILQFRYLREVAKQVSSLTKSSTNLEELTIRLNKLTWVLIILAVAGVVAPIGIECWKAYHSEPVVLRPPSAPPAPTFPSH